MSFEISPLRKNDINIKKDRLEKSKKYKLCKDRQKGIKSIIGKCSLAQWRYNNGMTG